LREEVDSLKLKAAEPSKNQPLQAQMAETTKVRIGFFIMNRKRWELAQELYVDPQEPSEIQKACEEYLRRGVGIFVFNGDN
jgi:hypothetical protein